MEAQWIEDTVTVGDMQMHYVRTGGNKPQIVLAHGFSDNGLCWLPVAQNLAADYDVILPDARGHGKSSRVRENEALDLPGDLAGFIGVLHLDRPVLGGHSMGASTAAAVDARFPGLVRALILEDPAWRDNMEPPPPTDEEKEGQPRPNPWQEWLMQVKSQPLADVIAKGRADNPTWPEAEFGPWAESKQQFDPNFVKMRESSPRRDWREVAKAITAPTLLITADPEKGSIVTADAAEEATKMNPHIQVAHIPNVGHSIRREAFDAYIKAIRAFLKDQGI